MYYLFTCFLYVGSVSSRRGREGRMGRWRMSQGDGEDPFVYPHQTHRIIGVEHLVLSSKGRCPASPS